MRRQAKLALPRKLMRNFYLQICGGCVESGYFAGTTSSGLSFDALLTSVLTG